VIVTLGGITAKQTFGASSGISDGTLSNKHMDGRMGLGNRTYNFIQPEIENTFFDNIKGQLAKPVFAYAEKKGGAIFDFGFFDKNKMTGPVAWVDHIWEEDWPAYRFFAEGFSLDPNSKVTPRKMNIHLDSATSISFTDPDIVTEFYSHIPGAFFQKDDQIYVIPCNSKPPGWTVVIDGQKFYTPGCQLVSETYDAKAQMCVGGLQNIGGGVDFSLLGINWCKGKYIMHDFTNPHSVRLGFAKQPGQ
jgi:aspergillopepsin I